MKSRLLIRLAALSLAVAMAGCSAGGSAAAEKPAASFAGTCRQTKPAGPRTFNFKLQSGVLTGTMLKGNARVTITNAVVKGNQLSFQTRYEASFPKGTFVTETFTGTLSGDTITGTMAVKTSAADFGSRPWQIDRETAGAN